jgi:glycosyltransferase involved in cell wall biosynthesis
MRILITSPVFPPDLGGPAVLVPRVGRFLVERGHEVKVIAFCSDPDPRGFSFEVETIPFVFLPLRYLRAFFRVFREAGKFDIVYVQEHLALLHVLAAKLRRTPVVIRIMVDGAWEISHRKGWCEGDDIVTFQKHRYGWQVRLTRFLQRRWWGWSRHIIACSEMLRQILIQNYDVPPDKVQRIYNGYNGPSPDSVNQTPGEAREILGLDADRRYLLTICRLMVWKGVDGIIDALRGLPDDIHLLVAGDGDMREAWEQHARDQGVEDRVQFLGNVPYEKIPLYLRAADIFVLNSTYEGLCLALLEVVNLGTPAIASDICGNPEIVEHEVSGLLVDPLDSNDLQRAIERMLADPKLCERFVAAGLEHARRFDPEERFAEVESALLRAASC